MVRKLTLSDTKDPAEAAHAAGLTYSQDDKPGIRRVKAGRAFRYLDAHGRPGQAKLFEQDPVSRHPSSLDQRLDLL